MTYESYILELLIDTGISLEATYVSCWSNRLLHMHASFNLSLMTSVEENRDDERSWKRNLIFCQVCYISCGNWESAICKVCWTEVSVAAIFQK